MSANMRLGFEPSTASQNITGYNSNHIVGGDTSSSDSGVKGPFIYAVSSPQELTKNNTGTTKMYNIFFMAYFISS